ncbi:murein L,D-transpeptidase catalytic domain family protein [Roseivirga sp. BDSF3-8]|uniref:murein L,D-transpeptidase catalytic domain family protein n=1 Tax=Roseivirga sp. BDSF3-8 TaxID=3241598 RepID=UPI0035323CDD
MIKTLNGFKSGLRILFVCMLVGVMPAFATGGSGEESGNAVVTAVSSADAEIEAINSRFEALYTSIDGAKPSPEVFRKAVVGFYNLELKNRLDKDRKIITIADFSKSANEKRLWVIDLTNKKTLFNTYVAHGRNTGNVFAKTFSNTVNSNMSSLGFYVTAETYHGKHGLSLRLDGQEKGINDNARRRAIVMHGADYVSEAFIKRVGRLGRSFGCPSIPMALRDDIIKTIADKTCLFIYYPDKDYESGSNLFDYTGLLTSL